MPKFLPYTGGWPGILNKSCEEISLVEIRGQCGDIPSCLQKNKCKQKKETLTSAKTEADTFLNTGLEYFALPNIPIFFFSVTLHGPRKLVLQTSKKKIAIGR